MASNDPEKAWSPERVAELKQLFEQGLSDLAISKILGRSCRSVKQRRIRERIFRPEHCGARPCPDDFPVVAPGKRVRELTEIYGCSKNMISRWFALHGIDARVPPPRQVPKPKPPKAPAKRRPYQRFNYTGASAYASEGDGSYAGRAADWLRLPKQGGWVIYRCTDDGKANHKGKFFRVGRNVKTEAEMIAFSESKGFVRDAWKVAA